MKKDEEPGENLANPGKVGKKLESFEKNWKVAGYEGNVWENKNYQRLRFKLIIWSFFFRIS